MKHIISAMAILGTVMPAFALPLGGCYTTADAQKKLAAEGHKVASATGDNKTWMSLGPNDSGYVLQADAQGAMCVVSVLRGVTTIKSLASTDLCDDPRRYPGAVAACKLAQAQGLPAKRSISAEALEPALSKQMVGPVNTTIAICVDQAGREVMCGRTETPQSGTGEQPRSR